MINWNDDPTTAMRSPLATLYAFLPAAHGEAFKIAGTLYVRVWDETGAPVWFDVMDGYATVREFLSALEPAETWRIVFNVSIFGRSTRFDLCFRT